MNTHLRLVYILSIGLVFSTSACLDPAQRQEQYVESARQYMEEGRVQEAIIQFRNALGVSGNLGIRLELAKAYQAAQDHGSAAKEYQQILEVEPNNQAAKLQVANYYLLGGIQDSQNFEKARVMAEEILAEDPSSVEARILLGNAYAGLQDLDRSAQELRSALDANPEAIAAGLYLGKLEMDRENIAEAERIFLETLENNPDSIPVRQALGQLYMASGNVAKGREYFREAFLKDKTNLQSLFLLVRFHLAAGQPEEIPGVFEEAMSASDDPDPLRLALARFHYSQGAFELARSILEGLEKEGAVAADASRTLAELDLRQNEFDLALQRIDSLLEQDREDWQALYLRGRLSLQRKNFQPALSDFDRALQLRPSFAGLHLARGAALLSLFRVSDARAAVEQALALNPRDVAANAARAKILAIQRRPSDLPEAIRSASAVLAAQPNNVDALTARGEAYFAQRNLAAARADFRRLVTLASDNPFFEHRLGAIEALAGNKPEAIQHFRKALAISPDMGDVLRDLVAVYARDKQFNQALAEVRRHDSTPGEITHTLEGQIHLAQNDVRSAEQSFRAALKANPEYYQAYLMLGELNVRKGDMGKAVAEVEELLRKNDEFAPAYLLKGYYLDAAGRKVEAAESYRKTMEFAADSTDGHWIAANNLAWILATGKQNLQEALDLARNARQARPNNPEFADTLGWVYFQRENYTLALDQFLFAVNQSPQPTAEHYFRLGMAYYEKKDLAHARDTLKKALDLNGNFDGAQDARQILSDMKEETR